MVGVGIVGFGYWGPNYLRVLKQLEDVEYLAICDSDSQRILSVKDKNVKKYTDYALFLDDGKIDAIIIATPPSTHFTLAMQALEKGKHILVEKPVTLKSEEAKELDACAKKKEKVFLIGHVFLYNDGIQYLRNHIHKEEFGKVHEIECIRQGHGPVRTDINVLWDLATHDISIVLYLLGKKPLVVTANGFKYRPQTVNEDSIIATFEFSDSVYSSIKVNWQYPIKERRVTIIGENQMIRFSDTDTISPIIVFHKTVTPHGELSNSEYGAFKMITSDDGYHVPVVKIREPLLMQIQDFLQCISNKTVPLSHGSLGVDVIEILEAAMISLKNNGNKVFLNNGISH